MAGRESGSSDIIPVQSAQGETRPRGLIDAISTIEYYHAQEKRGVLLSAGFFTMKQKIEYFEVGFRGAFISGLLTAMITPFAIGVAERMIPVFGTDSPSIFDRLFVFLLAFGFYLGYSSFIARAASLYIGPYTRSMIRNLVGGVIAGAISKLAIAFIFFHYLYVVVLDGGRVARLLARFGGSARPGDLASIYRWVMEFKPVLLTSAYLIAVTTLVFVVLPLLTMGCVSMRNRRLERVRAIAEKY